MCEKEVDANFVFSSFIWGGMSFFQLGVLLGNFEYSYIFLISRPIAFKYTVFGRWFSLSWITVCWLYLF